MNRVRYKKARWKNLLSTGNSFIEVDFTVAPATLVVGPNGGGKTTLLDALCFGQFGKPYRDIRLQQLVNTVNGEDCLVEIEVERGRDEFLIRRGLKPQIFEIYKNGVLVDQPVDKDYQGWLEREVLGRTMKVFTQVDILGSTSFVPFMQLKASIRREVVEGLLDIRVFSTMSKILSGRVDTNRDKVRILEPKLAVAKSKLSVLQEQAKRALEDKAAMAKAKFDESEEEERIAKIRDDEIRWGEELANSTEVKLIEDLGTIEALQARFNEVTETRVNFERHLGETARTWSFFDQNNTCPSCTRLIEESFRQKKLEELQARIDEMQAASPTLQEIYKEAQENLREACETGKAIVDIRQSVSRSKASADEHRRLRDRLKAEGDKILSQQAQGSVDHELVDTLEELTTLETSRAALSEERAVLDVGTAILRDGGIKSQVIKQYIPVINDLVNKYLAALDFFVRFELDEDFNEKILSRHRDDFSYHSFSEGEKMRIDLALLFAWRAIARMKHSCSSNLLIMDEVLDASMDMNGCDDFLKLVDSLGEDTNTFIITHRGDILMDRFKRVLKFEKQGNFSKLEDA